MRSSMFLVGQIPIFRGSMPTAPQEMVPRFEYIVPFCWLNHRFLAMDFDDTTIFPSLMVSGETTTILRLVG